VSEGLFLALDVGNTRVNWALFSGATVVDHGAVPHAALAASIPPAWGRTERVGLATVHGPVADALRREWPSELPSLPAPLLPDDVPIGTAVRRRGPPRTVPGDRVQALLQSATS